MPSSRAIRTFQKRLLAWYRVHQRKLPWRETRDPYRVLVSEVMLQQTQVDRVMPKYQEFLQRYPTLKDLAQARTGELRRVWYPLGYNVRPLRLRTIAREVLRKHDGRIPDSYEALVAMEGIGRYTAGAVLSFAFEREAPIVDTNVARLLSRYFGVPSRDQAKARHRLWALAEAVIPAGRAHDMNSAMMDLGATICVARAPRCPRCPLRAACRLATRLSDAPTPHAPASGTRAPGRARRD